MREATYTLGVEFTTTSNSAFITELNAAFVYDVLVNINFEEVIILGVVLCLKLRLTYLRKFWMS